MYYVTGLQHTKSNGKVIMGTTECADHDAAEYKVNEEWNYAYASEDFIGLVLVVYDDAGRMDNELSCNYVKPVPVEQNAQPAEQNAQPAGEPEE